LLSDAGYEVIEAEDGVLGLEAIRRDQFELVLCDVNMPRLDGITLVETVKADPKNAPLKILMLTADGHPAQIARARSLGAIGWLVKPVRPELLMKCLAKLVPLAANTPPLT
jgi:two-component system chemotaxis response regulator CheY